MTGPNTPDPMQVHRVGVALTTALRLSTLLPREQEAIFSILRSFDTAAELLPRLAGQPDADAYAAHVLDAMVDNYRRKLADLGR